MRFLLAILDLCVQSLRCIVSFIEVGLLVVFRLAMLHFRSSWTVAGVLLPVVDCDFFQFFMWIICEYLILLGVCVLICLFFIFRFHALLWFCVLGVFVSGVYVLWEDTGGFADYVCCTYGCCAVYWIFLALRMRFLQYSCQLFSVRIMMDF